MEELLTLAEVADYLKLKRQTVYNWVKQCKIPAFKIGKEWRFKKSMLEDWIDQKINKP